MKVLSDFEFYVLETAYFGRVLGEEDVAELGSGFDLGEGRERDRAIAEAMTHLCRCRMLRRAGDKWEATDLCKRRFRVLSAFHMVFPIWPARPSDTPSCSTMTTRQMAEKVGGDRERVYADLRWWETHLRVSSRSVKSNNVSRFCGYHLDKKNQFVVLTQATFAAHPKPPCRIQSFRPYVKLWSLWRISSRRYGQLWLRYRPSEPLPPWRPHFTVTMGLQVVPWTERSGAAAEVRATVEAALAEHDRRSGVPNAVDEVELAP